MLWQLLFVVIAATLLLFSSLASEISRMASRYLHSTVHISNEILLFVRSSRQALERSENENNGLPLLCKSRGLTGVEDFLKQRASG